MINAAVPAFNGNKHQSRLVQETGGPTVVKSGSSWYAHSLLAFLLFLILSQFDRGCNHHCVPYLLLHWPVSRGHNVPRGDGGAGRQWRRSRHRGWYGTRGLYASPNFQVVIFLTLASL